MIFSPTTTLVNKRSIILSFHCQLYLMLTTLLCVHRKCTISHPVIKYRSSGIVWVNQVSSSVTELESNKILELKFVCTKSKNTIVKVVKIQRKDVQGLWSTSFRIWKPILFHMKTFASPSWFNLTHYLSIPRKDSYFN